MSRPIEELTEWGGQALRVRWHTAPFSPPQESITQVSAVAVIDDGQAVLVSQDGVGWALPGGHPEEGEAAVETLRREVAEEACARVVASQYLGAQQIWPDGSDPAESSYYQLRYWARIELEPFRPRHECRYRRLVRLERLADELGWKTAKIAQVLGEAAAEVERKYRIPPTLA